MSRTMPSRRRPRNVTVAAADAPRLAVVASRTGADGRTDVLRRDDAFDGTPEQAAQHARLLATSLAERHACLVDAVVLDGADGCPLYSTQSTPKLGPCEQWFNDLLRRHGDAVRTPIVAGIASGLTDNDIVRQLLAGGGR